MAATFVATVHGGPQLLYALFFGIAMHHLSSDPRSQPGIDFCARNVLRLGVALLGARITAAQIAGLGWTTAAVVALGVTSTIALAVPVGRRLGLTGAQSVLSGGAVAICGASAALAISAVLPRRDDSERFTLLVVVAVTLFSTVAMVVYPLIAQTLGLPPHLAGLFLGGTIHDVAQVAGAGYMLGAQTGDVAIVVKLLRVSMLAFVVMALVAVLRARGVDGSEDGAGRRAPLVPWFLWLFVAMVVLNSVGALAPPVQAALGDVARACLLVAIAALGIKTSFAELARCGWRPLALILIETAWLALLVLGYVVWARG